MNVRATFKRVDEMAQKCPCTLEDEDANMVHREREGGWDS